MDYDSALVKTNGGWRYLLLIYLITSFNSLQYSVDLTSLTLAMNAPKYTCSGGRDKTGPTTASTSAGMTSSTTPATPQPISTGNNDECLYRSGAANNATERCTSWTYDRSLLAESIVTEFDLVCEREYLQKYVFLSFFAGDIISGFLGWFGDIIGRRKWILICCLWETLSNLAIGMAPNLSALLFFLFLRGLSCSLALQGLALLIELIPAKHRNLFSNLYWMFFCLGFLQGTWIFYVTNNWRVAKFVSTLPSLFYLTYIRYLPESPQWLLLKGRNSEAMEIFKDMAAMNRRKLSSAITDQSISCHVSEPGRFSDLFRLPNTRYKTIAIGLVLWANQLAYFGLIIDPTFFFSNIFLAMSIQGLIEVPSIFASMILAEKWGKKSSSITISLATGGCILAVPFIRQAGLRWLQFPLALLGKTLLVIAHNLLELMNSEIFPTSIRSLGMNLCYTFGTSAVLFAPYINSLLTLSYFLPAFIFGLTILVSSILIVFLPETTACPIAQRVEESETLRAGNEAEWSKLMRMNAVSSVVASYGTRTDDAEERSDSLRSSSAKAPLLSYGRTD